MKCQPNVEIAGSPRNVLRYSHRNKQTDGGRALSGLGAKRWLPTPTKLRMPEVEPVSETAGAKLRRRKGNSPDHQLRSQSITQCERESVRPNSQDVGLEAAIIERVRNSSLVECTGTDNVTRLKHRTEAVDRVSPRTVPLPQGRARTRARRDGRGAFSGRRSSTVRTGGAQRRANAGMSSVMSVGIRHTASLRVPGQR